MADPFIYVNLNKPGSPSSFYIDGVDLASITTELSINYEAHPLVTITSVFIVDPESIHISIEGKPVDTYGRTVE